MSDIICDVCKHGIIIRTKSNYIDIRSCHIRDNDIYRNSSSDFMKHFLENFSTFMTVYQISNGPHQQRISVLLALFWMQKCLNIEMLEQFG